MDKDENDAPTNRPGDTFWEAFGDEPVTYSLDDEGFPTEHEPAGDPDVPKFNHNNYTCIAQPEKDGRPELPRCEYYSRQLIHVGDSDGRKFMRRMCLHPAYKSLSGAGFDITDSAIYACELRAPLDPLGVQDMDVRDKKTMLRGLVDKKFRMFPTPEEAKAGKYTLKEDEDERK